MSKTLDSITLPKVSTILPNGLRIVHQKPTINTIVSSIQVFCDVGSVHETDSSFAETGTDGNRGSAHFIEHMCFKGTKKLPTARDVNLVFDNTGSESNAYTDRRHTCYYVTTNVEHTQKCIEVLGDMLLNSVFDKDEYMKEKEVVKEEAIKDEDDAELLAIVKADAILYDGSPYANTVDELKYHVGKHVLQYDAVVSMYKKYYTPSRFIVSVCSNNKFDDICKWASKAFQTNPKPCVPESLDLGQVKPLNELSIVIEKRKISPILVCIGFRTCSLRHEDKYPLKILKSVLSGRITSRMFMLLREENGLTYSSYASCDFFEQTGDFKLFAECNPAKFIGKPNTVLPLLVKMVEDLVKHGITEKELAFTKQNIEGNYKMKRENPMIIAKYNGKNVLMGIKGPAYQDKYDVLYKPITREQVNECIKKYFKWTNAVVSVVGAHPPSANKIQDIIY